MPSVSVNWGEGQTSASDGQRFSLPRKVPKQTCSTKFSDFALEFYTFVADNYAPFYGTPTSAPTATPRSFSTGSCTTKATWNSTSTTPTPTATQRSTSLPSRCSVGGFARASGARTASASNRIDPSRDYGVLKSLVGRADGTIDTSPIVEQWDRMGQF
jgi:Tn3 transposase DDE domain